MIMCMDLPLTPLSILIFPPQKCFVPPRPRLVLRLGHRGLHLYMLRSCQWPIHRLPEVPDPFRCQCPRSRRCLG